MVPIQEVGDGEKNCTGIYSANNKVSATTRRTLRYCYERLLFTFFSQNLKSGASMQRYFKVQKRTENE